jgi:3-methylcrotonyl-CoA carboxylase alpha subunit
MIPGTGWDHGGWERRMGELTLVVRGTPVRCAVEREDDRFVVRVGGVTLHLRLTPLEPGRFCLSTSGKSQIVRVAHAQARSFLHADGYTLEFATTAGGDPAVQTGHHDLTAPMPGSVAQILVREGDTVARGQPLVIVEAMKMEHVVRAPRAGRVRAVRAHAGDQVEGGAVLVEIAGEADGAPG